MKNLIYTLKKPNIKSLIFNLIIFSISTIVVGCHDSKFKEFEDNRGVVQVSDNRVILTPNHIVGIKSERYQPSLTLYGYLIPMQQTLISSQQRIKLFEVMVKNNQQVKKNQSLIRYLLAPSTYKNNLDFDLESGNENSLNDSIIHTSALDAVSKDNKEPLQTIQKSVVITNEYLNLKQMNEEQEATQGKKLQEIDTNPTNNYRMELHETLKSKPSKITDTSQPQSLLSIDAPFQGVLQHVYYKQEHVFQNFMPTILEKNQPILIIRSENEWRFSSILPKYAKSQLSIGQHVNFAIVLPEKNLAHENHTSNDTPEPITFTGQISSIKPMVNGKGISVNTNVVEMRNKQIHLKQGMKVQGKVNYGQMAVGTLVDQVGVHQIKKHDIYTGLEIDLSVFTKTNANIVAPVKAFVWVVGQNRKLTYQIVDVISFNAQTGQYLVAGIPSDVLICLISLPKSNEGKIVKIS